MGHGVKLSEMAEKMRLKNLTPDVDLAEKEVTSSGREQTGITACRIF